MSLLERLFNKEKKQLIPEKSVAAKTEKKVDEWQEIAGYIPVEDNDYQLVSVIGAAIAAGDQLESRFSIKRILKRNPEAQLVSVIAASIASADQPKKQIEIRSIKEKE